MPVSLDMVQNITRFGNYFIIRRVSEIARRNWKIIEREIRGKKNYISNEQSHRNTLIKSPYSIISIYLLLSTYQQKHYFRFPAKKSLTHISGSHAIWKNSPFHFDIVVGIAKIHLARIRATESFTFTCTQYTHNTAATNKNVYSTSQTTHSFTRADIHGDLTRSLYNIINIVIYVIRIFSYTGRAHCSVQMPPLLDVRSRRPTPCCFFPSRKQVFIVSVLQRVRKIATFSAPIPFVALLRAIVAIRALCRRPNQIRTTTARKSTRRRIHLADSSNPYNFPTAANSIIKYAAITFRLLSELVKFN